MTGSRTHTIDCDQILVRGGVRFRGNEACLQGYPWRTFQPFQHFSPQNTKTACCELAVDIFAQVQELSDCQGCVVRG
jgi:hypothetical protein